MKINNKKIVVPALAMAMATALAGSIAGSVAWYQYSTRATSGLVGTSAGSSRSLQLASELVDDEATDNLQDAHWGYHYAPESKGKFAPSAPLFDLDGKVSKFASHPVYQHFNNWIETDDNDFFAYDLYFQSLDNRENKREELDLYLTRIDIDSANPVIKSALRVELVPYTFDGTDWNMGTSVILSEKGGKTTMNDYLDLNNNKIMDHDGFAADDSDGAIEKYKANTPVVPEKGTDLSTDYFVDSALTNHPDNFHEVEGHIGDDGADLFKDSALSEPADVDGDGKLTADGTYYAFGADGVSKYYIENLGEYETKKFESIVANDDDPYNFVGGEALVKTDDEYAVKLTVKVWLEGWQQDNAISKDLEEGAEAIGYYSDEECENPAWSQAINGVEGESGAGLFKDKALEEPVGATIPEDGEYYREARHSFVPAQGADLADCFQDEELTIAADNFHSVEGHVGESGEGLFKDSTLSEPAEVDADGKLTADGTYYAFGADGVASYYHKGAAQGSYYAKGYIWDNASIGSRFNLGLRFAVEADK